MAATPLDSPLYRELFGDAELSQLFTDSAEVRAMMLVESALARAQGARGIIPEVSAQAIHRAAMEAQIDPAALAAATGQNGVPVPGFVAAFRNAIGAPEHGHYLHHGATSQDIIDTALALRLRQALTLLDERLQALTLRLADLADTHAETPMLARTWGQAAVATSFGAIVAGWGQPLLRHRAHLQTLRLQIETVSLSGAGGTASALPEAAKVRADMARLLGLGDPETSVHSTRDAQVALSAWLAGVAGSLGKMGSDLVFLAATGIDEVRLGASGASSTMPQKANPVAPSLVVALANLTAALSAAMQGAAQHQHQRDGAAWFTEWLTLPQMLLATGRALSASTGIAAGLAPDETAMARNIDATGGSIFAEALSFDLARDLPRPQAQARVKDIAAAARDGTRRFDAAARDAFPDRDLDAIFDAARQLGNAPIDARHFAKSARAVGT